MDRKEVWHRLWVLLHRGSSHGDAPRSELHPSQFNAMHKEVVRKKAFEYLEGRYRASTIAGAQPHSQYSE